MQIFNQHQTLIFVAALVAAFVIVVAVKKIASFPYKKTGPLLSAAERNFFLTLDRVAKPRFRIFIKVRMADLITVKSTGNSKRDIVALNKVAAKHIDFVLAHPETFEPVIAVELDDASHARKDRQSRDEFVNKAFAACGIPLLRFKAKARYDAADLEVAIVHALNPPAEKK